MSSQEELELAHKKALKALEGEKRAAVKKAKGTKGKKSKDAVAAVEADCAAKLKDLESKYQEKLQALEEGGGGEEEAAPIPAPTPEPAQEEPTTESSNTELSEKDRKLEKAWRKKEKLKEKEAQKQRDLEEEEANAGPSLRQVELEQIQAVLTPLNFKVAEIEADGHCLYRAVAAQTNREYSYTQIRKFNIKERKGWSSIARPREDCSVAY
jgi:OTU domain-containing protein 6